VLTVAGNVIFGSMVGYALAKVQLPGMKLLVVLVMITLITRDVDVRPALRAGQQAGRGQHVPRPSCRPSW
jgi:ABC-type glycerol-3-phosphate transport system permease component